MHCKDCKFWREFSKIEEKEKIIFWNGYCSLQKCLTAAFSLCKFLERRVK